MGRLPFAPAHPLGVLREGAGGYKYTSPLGFDTVFDLLNHQLLAMTGSFHEDLDMLAIFIIGGIDNLAGHAGAQGLH
jgi:hypothetical protein